MEIKNRSRRSDIYRPRPGHGHKYIKYKKYLSLMMLICVKQYFSNTWSSTRRKDKQYWGWVGKGVPYDKKHLEIHQFSINC